MVRLSLHRGQEEDRYEQSTANYQAPGSTTGVCVPRIHGVDRGRKIVLLPTWSWTTSQVNAGNTYSAPDTTETRAHEKEEIRRTMGRFYAQVHSVTKASEEADAETKAMLRMLDRLESAVRKGHLAIDLKKIDQCRRAVEREPFQKRSPLPVPGRYGVCSSQSGKGNGAWRSSVIRIRSEYRDGYCDLSPVLGGPVALWELDRPLEFADASKAAALSFFRGYDELRPLDYEKLIRLPLYHHLGLWANVADAQNTPTKIGWIKRGKNRSSLSWWSGLPQRLREQIPLPDGQHSCKVSRTVLFVMVRSSARTGAVPVQNYRPPAACLLKQHRTRCAE